MRAIAADDIEEPARYIAGRIRARLDAEQSVLWLISGGSAIKLAVRARQLLGALQQDHKLHVGLVDERYGEVDHKDSNTRQLLDSGFDTAGLAFYPVLTGQDIESATRAYGQTLRRLSRRTAVTIGLFGMGSDGHTAGLLPGNPLMSASDFVGHFDGDDYRRVTVTPSFIHRIDEAILYAVGDAKWPVLAELATTNLPVASLRGTDSLTVFSDYRSRLQ